MSIKLNPYRDGPPEHFFGIKKNYVPSCSSRSYFSIDLTTLGTNFELDIRIFCVVGKGALIFGSQKR